MTATMTDEDQDHNYEGWQHQTMMTAKVKTRTRRQEHNEDQWQPQATMGTRQDDGNDMG
jgi:hypothetical protein